MVSDPVPAAHLYIRTSSCRWQVLHQQNLQELGSSQRENGSKVMSSSAHGFRSIHAMGTRFSFGKEHAKDKPEGDLKEFWHFGQYLEEEDKDKFDYPENIEVVQVPEFNSAGKEAYQHAQLML